MVFPIFVYFHPCYLGKMNPFWRAYFSRGLKPPTSLYWVIIGNIYLFQRAPLRRLNTRGPPSETYHYFPYETRVFLVFSTRDEKVLGTRKMRGLISGLRSSGFIGNDSEQWPQTLVFTGCLRDYATHLCRDYHIHYFHHDTVDGRNPAPPGMVKTL